MHIHMVLTALVGLTSVKNASALTDSCQDHLTNVANILAPGAAFHEQLLNGETTPEVSRSMRASRATTKEDDLVAALGRSLRGRVDHLDEPSAAGEFLFGLDILGGLDPAGYTDLLTAALSVRARRPSRVLPALVGRGSLIFVAEKFTMPQRLTYLRALLGHAPARTEFMKVTNAAQWLHSTLTAPELRDRLGAYDVDLICAFTNAFATKEMHALRSGFVDSALAVGQWKLARRLAITTGELIGASACGAELARTLGKLDDVGRVLDFTP